MAYKPKVGDRIFDMMTAVDDKTRVDFDKNFDPLLERIHEMRPTLRLNPDGSISSHKFRHETLDGENWVVFPTIFPKDDKKSSSKYDDCLYYTEEKDWLIPFEEAKKRDEVIHFGKDFKKAEEIAEGSWKVESRWK